MNSNQIFEKHVYCTECQNFIMEDTGLDINIDCKFSDKCWFYNPEDSAPLHQRICYIHKK